MKRNDELAEQLKSEFDLYLKRIMMAWALAIEEYACGRMERTEIMRQLAIDIMREMVQHSNKLVKRNEQA